MHFNLYKFDYNPMIIVRLPKHTTSWHAFSFLALCDREFFFGAPFFSLSLSHFYVHRKWSGKEIGVCVCERICAVHSCSFLTSMTAT